MSSNQIAVLDTRGVTVAYLDTDSTKQAAQFFAHARRTLARGCAASTRCGWRPADVARAHDVVWFHCGRLIATVR